MKTKNDIKKICVFDFDQTIMKTPIRKVGIDMWEEYYDKPFPSKKWWTEPHSLDKNVFDRFIKPNYKILPDFLSNKKRDDVLVILLTNRDYFLKKYVEHYLDLYNIHFDDKIFRTTRMSNKSDNLERYIINFPNIKNIEIWEDRDMEIELYEEWKNRVGPWLSIDIKINIIKNLYEYE